MLFAPFSSVCLFLRRCFPLVVTLAATGRLPSHTCAVTKWRTRSEAESCEGGLSRTMRTQRGKSSLEEAKSRLEWSERNGSRGLIEWKLTVNGA